MLEARRTLEPRIAQLAAFRATDDDFAALNELAPIHDMMLRTPEDYAAGIELHTATLAALKKGDPVEIEEEMYRHLGHFEAIVVDVLQRTPHRQMPAFLLAGTH